MVPETMSRLIQGFYKEKIALYFLAVFFCKGREGGLTQSEQREICTVHFLEENKLLVIGS